VCWTSKVAIGTRAWALGIRCQGQNRGRNRRLCILAAAVNQMLVHNIAIVIKGEGPVSSIMPYSQHVRVSWISNFVWAMNQPCLGVYFVHKPAKNMLYMSLCIYTTGIDFNHDGFWRSLGKTLLLIATSFRAVIKVFISSIASLQTVS